MSAAGLEAEGVAGVAGAEVVADGAGPYEAGAATVDGAGARGAGGIGVGAGAGPRPFVEGCWRAHHKKNPWPGSIGS